ncbi:four-helix bundle copper-binding protein, partial [Ralstonia pseudosolanacearum]
RFCALARDFLERNSEFAELLLEDCAEICQQTMEECVHHAEGHCRKCAEACEQCKKACLEVAGAAPLSAAQQKELLAAL